MMNIKEFYMNTYPTDELGIELDSKATFAGLVTQLFGDMDVYDYIGVYPEKGYCTYTDERGRYESNKHIEPRRGVHKMPISIMWNAFFY